MKNYLPYCFAGLLALLQCSLLSAAENPILKSVPADTLFFSGNTQLINLDDFPLINFKPATDAPMTQAEQDALEKEPAFFYALYLDLIATIKKNNHYDDNSALRSHYGIAANMGFSFYSVGITPVIKITLSDEQALWKVLDQAEKKSALQHQQESFEGMQLRVYPMTNKYQFVVSMQTIQEGQKLATLSLMSNTIDARQKKLILGLTQPEQSVLSKVNNIQQENQYLPLSVNFLDFQQLIRSLFQVKENPWVALFGDQDQFFANLSASNCEADINKIAAKMPRIIAGYKNYQVQGQNVAIELQALLELTDQEFKTELHRFRGFIPDYIRHGAKENILSFGLGVNFSQFSPFLFYISKVFRESSFQCEQLKDIQKSIAEFNPMMLALVTGVVDGIQGVAFALQDFTLNTDKEKNNTIEYSALLTLSADEPLKVWQMLAALSPQNALIIPSDTPRKLNVSELSSSDLELFIALKGKHLVLYSGKKAQLLSETLSKEKLLSNGLFQKSLNYTRLSNAMKDLRSVIMLSDKKQVAIPAESCVIFDETIAILSQFSGFIDFQSDFVERGWSNTLNADIRINPIIYNTYQLPGKYEIHYIEEGCQLVKDGLEEILADGTGFYQQYSDDEQCFVFETRYRWTQNGEHIKLQYVSERTRPDGVCSNQFEQWKIPEAQYINDVCQLRTETDGNFSCVYNWDGVLNKAVYKKL